MKTYKNNTSFGIVIPVKAIGIKPTSWIKFKSGESKELPSELHRAAELNGLEAVKVEVKAVESSIAKTKIETKQIKKKSKNKGD